ncbi:MAG: hypothetical protein HQL32_09565 [Planctomycetes bacterium]|nr:hypothetical protein [Planctomycetota bacterium]
MSQINSEEQKSIKEDEIDLVELFLILWKKKFFIGSIAFIITLLTALHQLYIAKEIFKSDCVILPVSASNSGGMLAQLGGLASFVGASAPKSENTIELILKSRSFARELVKEFDLTTVWKQSLQEASLKVRGKLGIDISKKSPEITISWEDEDPKFAQKVVTRVIELAQQKMAEHELSKKNTQVSFLEERVKESRKEMIAAEDNLRLFQEKFQSVEIEGQAAAIIAQIQALKTEQQSKEVQLEVSRTILNPQAKEVKLLDMTVEQLQKKVDQLIGESKQEISAENNLAERSLMEIPKIGLEYARLMREVRITQKIYGLLLEQLEMSKIEAQKNVESFEVIDEALVPEKRIKPKRTLTVAIALVTSTMLAVMLVLLGHFIANIKKERQALV